MQAIGLVGWLWGNFVTRTVVGFLEGMTGVMMGRVDIDLVSQLLQTESCINDQTLSSTYRQKCYQLQVIRYHGV
jgi:hypothetical protein